MKKLFFLFFVTLIIIFSSCMQTRYVTEKYIKKNIEIHNPGKFSSIKLYSIYKGFTDKSQNSYLELTGYKYEDKKELVIAADKYFKARSKYLGDNTTIVEIVFIELNIEQCKSIVENHKILLNKIKEVKPKRNEVVYQDYSVSDDLFISFRKKKGHGNPTILNLWIQGDKFSINSDLIIDNFEKFLEY